MIPKCFFDKIMHNIYIIALGILISCHNLCVADECVPVEGAWKTCRCKTKNGGATIDLLKLFEGSTKKILFQDVKASNDSYLYSYQPCKPFSEPDASSSCNNVAVCQKKDVEPAAYVNCGNEDKATFYGDPHTNSLNLTYTTGDQRTSNVMLRCAVSVEKDFKAFGETKEGSTIYEFLLSTKHVCVSGTGGGGGGLSVGSILVIVFFVVVLVYIVGGILFLHFARGARGVEQFPNHEFWTDFPLLVKDGVHFVVSGCKSDSQRTYEKI